MDPNHGSMFRPTTSRRRANCGYCIVEICIMALWMAGIVIVTRVMHPVHKGYFCDDQSLMYPLRPDTVPDSVIILLTLLAPPVLMSVVEVLSRSRDPPRPSSPSRSSAFRLGKRERRRGLGRMGGRVLSAYVAYFFGYLLMTLIVTVLKSSTGQLRPHFMAVCQPQPLAAPAPAAAGGASLDAAADTPSTSTCVPDQYIVEYNCTNGGTKEKDKLIRKARESFPSGHAAYAAYLAVFMTMYIEKRIVTRHLHLLKLTVYGLLMTYALWISVTRVADYKHTTVDVVVGGLIGAVLAPVMFLGAATRTCYFCSQPSDEENGSDKLVSDTMGDTTSHHHNHNSHNNNNNNNNNNINSRSDDDEDDDVENGNLDPLETETPTTPTPLLLNGLLLSNSGLRIGPLRLQGDKHKFPRRATLQ